MENVRKRYNRFRGNLYYGFIDRHLSLADDATGYLEVRELQVRSERRESFNDGCDGASAWLGVRSSCFECPFDECIRPDVLCVVDDELRCDSRIEDENTLRRSILDSVGVGFGVVCSECGKIFEKGDSIYRLKTDLKGKYLWCRACFSIELGAFCRLTEYLGVGAEKMRSYERINE